MHVRLAATGVLLAGSWLVLGATPALAVCDAYSGTCATPAPEGGGSSTTGGGGGGGSTTDGSAGGGTTGSPSTLPFTGGELVLLSALGVGALAGGTALVVAGRRKTSVTA